jgi:hypothetical protein
VIPRPFNPHAAQAAAASLFCALSVATQASAGVVEPGETVVLDSRELPAPAGRVLAQAVLPFSIDYEPADGVGDFLDFSGTLEGTLTSTVVRDESRGTLTFLYDVDLDRLNGADADASDASALIVDGFDTFTTDVAGILDREHVILASRTKDGGTVKLSSDDPGLGGAPRLVVRTDATDFAPTGTARFFAGDELPVRTPDGLEIELASGTAIVGGTFQPVDAPPPPPTPIPLPPAVWSGIVGLIGVGIATASRRRVSVA